jgi:hypothetical protein
MARWVKSGNNQSEYKMSVPCLEADILFMSTCNYRPGEAAKGKAAQISRPSTFSVSDFTMSGIFCMWG